MLSPLTKQLIEALCSLPGIGPRSAQRLTCQLLTNKGKEKAMALAQALEQASKQVSFCKQCRYFTEHALCPICSNPKRDRQVLCVVENPMDVIALEQAQAFRGNYFVLHGRLSPIDGVTPHDLGIPFLLSRLQQESMREIILATNPTVEGRATAQYLAAQLTDNHIHVMCTRIAHGVPIGGELEYLDGSTLSHAFHSRQPM